MTALASISDRDLLDRTPRLVLAERGCSADVIAHLMEIDRRRLYLDAACRSLACYCIERLGLSEDEAAKRVRVARVARRIPEVIEELRAGVVHLTGLWLLAPLLTDDNAKELLAAARGKTRRQIEEIVARHAPKPDLPERVCPQPQQQTMPTASGTKPTAAPAAALASSDKYSKIQPLSASRWSVQLGISAELKAKIDEAERLLSHALASGDLAALLDRALDALLERETKRRFGAGKSRKPRPLKSGSRHIPVELVRAVTERDGGRCTFVDEHGNRCSARAHLTLEHRHPFAKGGAASADNLCLLCSAHNHHSARKAFGEAHVQQKIIAAEYDRAQAALCKMGFREAEVRKALATLKQTSSATRLKELIVEALAVLVPPKATLMVRDSSRPRWRSSPPSACPGPGMTLRSPGRRPAVRLADGPNPKTIPLDAYTVAGHPAGVRKRAVIVAQDGSSSGVPSVERIRDLPGDRRESPRTSARSRVDQPPHGRAQEWI